MPFNYKMKILTKIIPLDANGKRLMKEAIEGPLTGRKLGG
jgi:hypothetical protein